MARQFEMTQNAVLTLYTAGKTCTEDIKVNVAVPGEDVATETEAYTEKLLVLETAITELENELDGKINGEDVGDETEVYTDRLATLETAITELETELQDKAAGGGEQATPVISVSSNGLITATAGTKSSTHQLAFQAAKTITPSTTSQIAVSSGYYTGGNVTVAAVTTQTKTVTPTSTTQNVTPDNGKFLSKVTVNGDANLVASNIVSGKTIFGVTGTATTGSGGDTSVEDGLITRTVSAYTNDRTTYIGNYAFTFCSNLTTASFPVATSIGNSAFAYCSNLTTISFPKVTSLGSGAFYYCSNLTTASFPKVTSIGGSAFYYCSNLTTASFPVATSIGSGAFAFCSLTTISFSKVTSLGNSAFYYCSNLTTISFPKVTSIGGSAFAYCSSLTTISFPVAKYIGSSAFRYCNKLSEIYLTASSICSLAASNAFSNTSIWSNKGSIFVPSSLVTKYKTATNWAFFSNRIYSA